jgi:uncharacterized membrane protein
MQNNITTKSKLCKHNSIFIINFVIVFLFHTLLSTTINRVKAQQQTANITQTIATLSEGRYQLAATSSGELIFFGGGLNATGASERVDICNVTSGSWTTATLSIPRFYLAAASSYSLVFFAGGWNGTTSFDRVDIYNVSDGSWSTATPSQAHQNFAGASVGNLVFFGGGVSLNNPSNVVDIYNASSNVWTSATLSEARWWISTVASKTLVFFGGGQISFNVTGYVNVVDVYDVTSGVWSVLASPLSEARGEMAATSIGGDVVIFAGGETFHNCQQVSNAVDVYNVSSSSSNNVMHLIFNLSVARCFASAAAVEDVVLIGGGANNTTYYDIVDIYNVTSNTWSSAALNQSRAYFAAAATSTTNKIFFGGGWNNNGVSNIVDIFEVILPSFQVLNSSIMMMPTQLSPSSFPISSFVPVFMMSSLLTNSISSTLPLSIQPKNISIGVVVGLVVGLVALLIGIGLVLFLILFVRKRRKKQKSEMNEEEQQVKRERLAAVESDMMSTVVNNDNQILITQTYSTYQPGIETLKSVTPCQIPLNELEIGNEIGEGTYGRVCVGKWKKHRVALKFCQNKGMMDEFMREANLMILLPPHPNVVRMYGVSIDGTQPIIVMEYCAGGSLDKVLHDENRYISMEQKNSLSL